jgi:hypothetical protein
MPILMRCICWYTKGKIDLNACKEQLLNHVEQFITKVISETVRVMKFFAVKKGKKNKTSARASICKAYTCFHVHHE